MSGYGRGDLVMYRPAGERWTVDGYYPGSDYYPASVLLGRCWAGKRDHCRGPRGRVRASAASFVSSQTSRGRGGLPAQFGSPPCTRADIAVKVAATIMGCWTGA